MTRGTTTRRAGLEGTARSRAPRRCRPKEKKMPKPSVGKEAARDKEEAKAKTKNRES